MPFVRIEVPEGQSAEYHSAVADEVYNAMRDTLNVPENDRFMVVTEHAANDLIIDRTYLGVERSAQCIVIQISLNAGRSVDMKRAFYKALADRLNQRVALRREDVFINLIEVAKENWSFGNGEAQYAS